MLRCTLKEDSTASVDDAALAKATITFTTSAVYDNGELDEPATHTMPLKTFKANMYTHLAIRNEDGVHTEHLSMRPYSYNDIVANIWLPGIWMLSGEYSFEIVAKLEDDTCLFAFSLTQHLEGDRRCVLM